MKIEMGNVTKQKKNARERELKKKQPRNSSPSRFPVPSNDVCLSPTRCSYFSVVAACRQTAEVTAALQRPAVVAEADRQTDPEVRCHSGPCIEPHSRRRAWRGR